MKIGEIAQNVVLNGLPQRKNKQNLGRPGIALVTSRKEGQQMEKYMEAMEEIKADFGSNWSFPAAETVLKLARREYRDSTLTNAEFEEIQTKALELMQPYITEKYADK